MTRHALLLSALWACLWIGPARAQALPERGSDVPQRRLVLTKESEEGFRRFMDLVRSGKLGAEIQEADISVADSTVELELRRKSSPPMVLRLSRRASATGVSRHFDVEALENASAGDLARVGHLLDEVFTTSPFQELPERRAEIPSAESLGGEDESRVVEPASLRYTIGIIVLLGLGMLASIVTLCLPPEMP